MRTNFAVLTLAILAIAFVTFAQSESISNQQIEIGQYVVALQMLSDAKTEGCIGVYPNLKGEATLYCSPVLASTDSIELASEGYQVGTFKSYNVRAAKSGPDAHCLISISDQIGPKPEIHCML